MPRVRAVHLGLIAALGTISVVPSLAVADSSTQDLDRRVRKLENILDSGQVARLIQRVNSLESELRELRGRIETQSHRMDQLRKRQRNLYGDLDRRIRALEVAREGSGKPSGAGNGSGDGANGGYGGSGEYGAGDTAAGDTAAGETGAENREPGGQGSDGVGSQTSQASQGHAGSDQAGAPNDREAYAAAYELLKQGRYDKAATGFAGFVQQYPDSPYADNAQYWLGESRYVTGDFDAALEAFRGVTSSYPDSNKVSDARLKTGYTLYELGRYDAARSVLQELVSGHAGSTTARLAEERLLKIKRRQPGDAQ